jgi:hypothetical protein
MDMVKAMIDGGFSNGAVAAILDACYHMATEFVKIHFEHTFCESNTVAHELARLARGHEQNVWLDDPPTSIIPMLITDVTLVMNE